MKGLNTQYFTFQIIHGSNLALFYVAGKQIKSFISFLIGREDPTCYVNEYLICWKHPKVTIRVSTTKVKKHMPAHNKFW